MQSLEKTGLGFWKWRPYKVRSLLLTTFNGPPSANQVASKDEPRRGHAVCTLRLTRWDRWFLTPFMPKRMEMALSANQVASKDEPRHGHAVCTLRVTRWDHWFLTPFMSKRMEMANGPPSANQVASKDEPRRGHAVCTLRVHPPTSPVLPFLLTQN